MYDKFPAGLIHLPIWAPLKYDEQPEQQEISATHCWFQLPSAENNLGIAIHLLVAIANSKWETLQSQAGTEQATFEDWDEDLDSWIIQRPKVKLPV